MTWQLSSFALLALALAAGFAWYDRARPSAKVVALVATLAALAALGRVAFAPLPSVKPTTDIVLLSGYVLGGPPGFVVGAVGGLASNIFFGQGPFTPWQMAAWGVVGLFGALLARLFGRDLGRWSLAVACMISGFAYGAFLDFHLWVQYAGQHTWAEYAVIAGRGLPFNVTHAVGNAVFCLAFGPLLVRALQRYRDRLQIEWKPVPAGSELAAVAIALLVVLGTSAGDARAADRAQTRAISYLRATQNADGGFGSDRGRASSQLQSSWAVLGLVASGRDPRGLRRNGRSAVDYIVRGIGQVRSLPDLERTILALASARRSPRSVGGRDLVAELARKRRSNGSFGGLVNQTAFAILALRAAGRPRSDAAIRAAARWLARQRNGDGGFNFGGRGGTSGIDDTAAALQALAAAGQRRSATVRRAGTFLARRQNSDGGMPLTPGDDSNAQSTAWAIQGLVAAGREPARARRRGARSPLAYLRSLQTSDGAVRYSRTSRQSPVWVTAQALTGFGLKPFPLR
ncbi:MAG TPA: prenyltransferase/squalene oxidase repeat-containing protein [Solirubrobacteraceae bacterium]